eukprot:TRINITY_DN68046_c5_g1_i1.p1 TRINITY_DN68046_c5_g1~~TRINITY_DN68046_c5_g1_i1.p1  ORF type:complete len:997 (-),score=48.97 TRINITY_DN68046_c5_g1_i1:83-3073(-)
MHWCRTTTSATTSRIIANKCQRVLLGRVLLGMVMAFMALMMAFRVNQHSTPVDRSSPFGVRLWTNLFIVLLALAALAASFHKLGRRWIHHAVALVALCTLINLWVWDMLDKPYKPESRGTLSYVVLIVVALGCSGAVRFVHAAVAAACSLAWIPLFFIQKSDESIGNTVLIICAAAFSLLCGFLREQGEHRAYLNNLHLKLMPDPSSLLESPRPQDVSISYVETPDTIPKLREEVSQQKAQISCLDSLAQTLHRELGLCRGALESCDPFSVERVHIRALSNAVSGLAKMTKFSYLKRLGGPPEAPEQEDPNTTVPYHNATEFEGDEAAVFIVTPNIPEASAVVGQLALKILYNHGGHSDLGRRYQREVSIMRDVLVGSPFLVPLLHSFVDTVQPELLPDWNPSNAREVQTHGAARTSTTLFLIMPLYDGSLARLVHDWRQMHTTRNSMPTFALPERFVLWTMVQLLTGISHMQETQVCHRDLKPDNVLLSYAGEGSGKGVKYSGKELAGFVDTDPFSIILRISDFGHAADTLQVPYHTQFFDKGGAPFWMPPEIIVAAPGPSVMLDCSKYDMFSLAVTIFLMCDRFPIECPSSLTMQDIEWLTLPPQYSTELAILLKGMLLPFKYRLTPANALHGVCMLLWGPSQQLIFGSPGQPTLDSEGNSYSSALLRAREWLLAQQEETLRENANMNMQPATNASTPYMSPTTTNPANKYLPTHQTNTTDVYIQIGCEENQASNHTSADSAHDFTHGGTGSGVSSVSTTPGPSKRSSSMLTSPHGSGGCNSGVSGGTTPLNQDPGLQMQDNKSEPSSHAKRVRKDWLAGLTPALIVAHFDQLGQIASQLRQHAGPPPPHHQQHHAQPHIQQAQPVRHVQPQAPPQPHPNPHHQQQSPSTGFHHPRLHIQHPQAPPAGGFYVHHPSTRPTATQQAQAGYIQPPPAPPPPQFYHQPTQYAARSTTPSAFSCIRHPRQQAQHQGRRSRHATMAQRRLSTGVLPDRI